MEVKHFKKPKRCALCKQERDWKELTNFDGHFVCPDCLKLMQAEGITFPDDLNSDIEYE